MFHYTDVKLKPKKNSDHFSISSSQLPQAISIVESKLASHVSQLPALNFLVYVPPPSLSPLLIATPDGGHPTDTFLVPQWGSVIIYNSHNSSAQQVKMEDLMPSFIQHINMLLGIPLNVSGYKGYYHDVIMMSLLYLCRCLKQSLLIFHPPAILESPAGYACHDDVIVM